MISDSKPVKKLRLDSETLRILDADRLTEVVGGNAAPPIKSISLTMSGPGCPRCCGDCNDG